MKTIKIIFIVLATVLFTSASYSQTKQQVATAEKIKTETFKVWGNCESCQARIEKAAKIDGVSAASWNKDTKMLTVSFHPSKTSDEAIQKKIAAAGHDTEKFKADDKVYDKLPGCCKYERKQ
jgi:copper chaperone CopZ